MVCCYFLTVGFLKDEDGSLAASTHFIIPKARLPHTPSSTASKFIAFNGRGSIGSDQTIKHSTAVFGRAGTTVTIW
jgi:hypothetical protein